MKKGLLLFLLSGVLSLSFLGCSPKELPTEVVVNPSTGVSVKLSHQTTKSELEKIKQQLINESNIEIDYSKSEFFENGNLRFLRLGVMTPNGNVGSTSADLVTLQFKYYGFTYKPDKSLYVGFLGSDEK